MAALVIVSWVAAEYEQLTLHRLMGYGVFALLLFRLYWGFAGSGASRFAHFVRGPRAFFAYASRLLDRSSPATVGHNPMGGWSVVAMLGALSILIVLGLFASDAQSVDPGPFYRLVGFGAARAAGEVHEAMVDVLLILVLLHVAAILFYLAYRRENLVGAMITGVTHLPPGTPAPGQVASNGHAAVAFVVSLAVVILIANAELFY
jgi:cytochrome b